MPSYLCLSVTFLDPAFHGRRDGGEPEWPPSPLRLFQALVAAAAARWNERHRLAYAVPALEWLAAQPPPTIVAPAGVEGAAYRLSVPNNAMDIVARAWTRGNESGKGDANPATHRVMKTVRPMRLPDGTSVFYLWEMSGPVPDDVRGHLEVLSSAARSLVTLGWGVDLVAAHGVVLLQSDVDSLLQNGSEVWRPTTAPTANGLRVPTPGTLAALTARHEAFLGRLRGDGFNPVPPLSAFAVVGYRRETDPPNRPFAAFELWRPVHELAVLPPGKSRFRPFDPVLRTPVVAGMVRHAVGAAAATARPEEADWRNTFVLGHGDGENGQATTDQRFAFLPLPSLELRGASGGARARHVGMIRRVLVVGPPGSSEDVDWVRRALSGQELIDETNGQPRAVLSVIPSSDRNVSPYSGRSSVWSTVTPVVLPGYDDARPIRTEQLLRRAIAQAGLPETLARNAELEWRNVGFLPGVDLATRYRIPRYFRERRYPRYHVRIRWRNGAGRPVAIPGPIAIGGARYCGIGLFIADTG